MYEPIVEYHIMNGTKLTDLHISLMLEDLCPECLGDVSLDGVCTNCKYDTSQDIPTIELDQDHNLPVCGICDSTMIVCDICGMQWCMFHTPNPSICPSCGDRGCCG